MEGVVVTAPDLHDRVDLVESADDLILGDFPPGVRVVRVPVERPLPYRPRHLATRGDVGDDERRRVAVASAVETPRDERAWLDEGCGAEQIPALRVERLSGRLNPTIQPHALEVRLVCGREIGRANG